MTLPFRPKLLWVDMEMSGLNPRYNRILEFACIITDEKLQYQHEGPHIILHCDQEHLLTMDEWNTKYPERDLDTTPSQDYFIPVFKPQFRSNKPNNTS